jgi:hypothetical protein
LKKETEQDGKTVYSQTGRVNIVKMAILPRVSYRFNAIPMKIPVSFFTKTEKSILIFMRKYRRPRVTKGILSLKKKRMTLEYHRPHCTGEKPGARSGPRCHRTPWATAPMGVVETVYGLAIGMQHTQLGRRKGSHDQASGQYKPFQEILQNVSKKLLSFSG